MGWQLHPAAPPLFLIGLGLAFLALRLMRRPPASRSVPGEILVAATSWWLLSYSLELFSAALPAKLFWNHIQLLGIAPLPVAWIAFAMEYTGQQRRITTPRTIASSAIPAAMVILAFTNGLHNLIWQRQSLISYGAFTGLRVSFNWGMWLFIAYAGITILASTTALLQLRRLSHHLYSWQSIALLSSSLLPVLIGIVELTSGSPIRGVTLVPLATGIAVVPLACGVFRLRESDIVPVARERMFEDMSDAVMVLDAENRVVDVNPSAERMLGRSRKDIIGKTAAQAWPAQWEWNTSRSPDGGTTEGEIIVHRDGSTTIYDVRISPLRDWQGRLMSRIVVARDITENRKMEQELLRSQRLQSAGQIAGQVAHDFNNLLGPIVAYPELIRMTLPEAHPALEFCEAMEEAANQMAAINEDMMALGRRGVLEQEPVELNRLIAQYVARMKPAPSTMEVRLELSPRLPYASGSAAQLLRVIVNLISNAREAMDDTGVLTIRTDEVHVDQPMEGFDRIEVGKYVRLQVCDTGRGIPLEIRDRIFDAFFTTKTHDKRRGAGLGLSVVTAIVGDHRGHVAVESEEGVGTTFHVYLPAMEDAPREEKGVSARGREETILVVDDDPLQREVSATLLRELGYRVEVANGGEAALEYLKAQSADLLMLDMVMPPGIDGAETYRQALKIRPGQKAIVVSGFSPSSLVEEIQALGGGAYLRKPVTMERLSRAVRDELDRQV